MTPNQRRLETYRQGNIEAALIVVADVERYPAGSLLSPVGNRGA